MARDAAEIKPKFIPDMQLLPRDNSGGLDWEPRVQVWGDGGKPMGQKSYLSASGGDVENMVDGGSERPREKTNVGKVDRI